MEDYRKKKITKAQLWDKLHEERRMWMDRVEKEKKLGDEKAKYAAAQSASGVKKVFDMILASLIKSSDIAQLNDDGELVIDAKMVTQKDGYVWAVRVEKLDDETLRIFLKEVEDGSPIPKTEEKKEEQ